MFQAFDCNLTANGDAFATNISKDVNDKLADYFQAFTLKDGTLLVIGAGSVPYFGALTSVKHAVPVVPDINSTLHGGAQLTYFGLDVEVMIPSLAADNLARLELDLKWCLFDAVPNATPPSRNVANASTQWNMDTKTFDIDGDPPGWLDTGINPGALTPDVFHKLGFRVAVNQTAGTFSVTSFNFDGTAYPVPTAKQNVPLQQTNWTGKVIDFQIQMEGFHKGVVMAIFKPTAKITYSDQAFA
jgi:hypothetical protein